MEKSMSMNGDRVSLFPISDHDTKKIVRWRNQPEIKKWFLDRKNFTVESHREWLSDQVENNKAFQWIIRENSSDEPIGTVYLRDIDRENYKCELGIYIGELKKAGLGYGKDAVMLATEYAFATLGMKKVFLRVISSNKKAIDCYRASGYTMEGVAHMDRWIDGKAIDVVFMARYASEN